MIPETSLTTIETPIFVFADDLRSFDSVDGATAYIEPWDVAEVTEAFDAVGGRLIVTADGVDRTRHTVGGGRTSISRHPTAEADPSALATLLWGYLSKVDLDQSGFNPIEERAAPLAELVQAVHRLTSTR